MAVLIEALQYESRKGPSFSGTDFSVANRGIYDVKRLMDGKKQSEHARGMASQSTLMPCFGKDMLEDQVIIADIYFSISFAEH